MTSSLKHSEFSLFNMTVMQYSQVAPDHQFVLVVHLILEPQEHQGYPKIWY